MDIWEFVVSAIDIMDLLFPIFLAITSDASYLTSKTMTECFSNSCLDQLSHMKPDTRHYNTI